METTVTEGLPTLDEASIELVKSSIFDNLDRGIASFYSDIPKPENKQLTDLDSLIRILDSLGFVKIQKVNYTDIVYKQDAEDGSTMYYLLDASTYDKKTGILKVKAVFIEADNSKVMNLNLVAPSEYTFVLNLNAKFNSTNSSIRVIELAPFRAEVYSMRRDIAAAHEVGHAWRNVNRDNRQMRLVKRSRVLSTFASVLPAAIAKIAPNIKSHQREDERTSSFIAYLIFNISRKIGFEFAKGLSKREFLAILQYDLHGYDNNLQTLRGKEFANKRYSGNFGDE